AGSDASAIRSAATRVDGGWLLTGQKVFTTGGGLPGTTLAVTAKVSVPGDERQRVSLFLVPNDAEGVTVRRLHTVGRHILGTCEIFYDGVFVPDEDLLGGAGQGWRVL